MSYAYDNLGRTLSAAIPAQTQSFTWDALGRQLSGGQTGRTVSYQYDLASRRTRMTWPDAAYLSYDYDDANDLTFIRENGVVTGAGVLAQYGYDNLGQRTSLIRGNGADTTWGYDGASRLTSIAHDLAGSTNDVTLGFTYNPAGQIVTRATDNDLYVFDKAVADVSYTANGLNQYTAVGTVTPTYDSQGDLLTDGSASYSYDALGRLSGSTGVGGLDYDPLDRLESETGGTTHFLWDGADLIAEYDASGTLLRRYAHGPGLDEPLTWWEGADLLTRRWQMLDERHSVIGVSKGNGGSYSINAYDDYGIPATTNTGRFAYTGQLTLTGMGVYSYKARAYHPGWGRFLQPDPVGYDGDGPNLYAYVLNDPLNLVDPFGLCTGSTFVQLKDGSFVGTLCRQDAFPNLGYDKYNDHESGGGGFIDKIANTLNIGSCIAPPGNSPDDAQLDQMGNQSEATTAGIAAGNNLYRNGAAAVSSVARFSAAVAVATEVARFADAIRSGVDVRVAAASSAGRAGGILFWTGSGVLAGAAVGAVATAPGGPAATGGAGVGAAIGAAIGPVVGSSYNGPLSISDFQRTATQAALRATGCPG